MTTPRRSVPPGLREQLDLGYVFGSVLTFGQRPLVTELQQLVDWQPDVAVLGAPFDLGTTNRPGARFGPRALRTQAYEPGTFHLDLGLEIFDWLEVVDFGEGMTREIIDTRLTRLFSSAKEGDYTKIGRFGIGFVSVFAIDPEVVCVDTGRAGEYWRVVFRRDRSFERIRLAQPVEGTTVRLYRQASAQEVEAARGKARATLEYWCKHVRIELRLDGEPMSGALDLGGLCKVEHREEGTHLVMALVPEAAGLRGYYHGGLTLHEERDDSLPHVAFKLDSRFLEHSLTRDNVIRDENYAKAMAIVAEVARTRLVAELRATLVRGVEDAGARELLYRCAARHVARGEEGWTRPALVPMLGGPAMALAELRGGPLWRASRMSQIGRAHV